MAHTVSIPQNILNILAEEVAQFLPNVGIPLTQADNPEIGETFPVWFLPASAVIAENPLSQAIQTGKFHHQIYRNGRPIAFAYSQAFGSKERDWKITAAFESSVPADIDVAVDISDKDIPQDGDTRLLLLPAYMIQAIWIIDQNGQNFIVPAVLPDEFKATILQRPYSAMDFFEILKKVQHIIGIQI